MIRLGKEVELNTLIIKKLIEIFKTQELPRLNKLYQYYIAKNITIGQKTVGDQNLPNNKIAHPFATYITNTLAGYFMGDGVTYTSVSEDSCLDELKMILEYSDEQDENMELAKSASIFGKGIELLWIDEEGNIRIKEIDPREMILVYDDTLEDELLYTIRFYPSYDIVKDQRFYKVEIYTQKEIILYKADELLANFTLIETTPHYFDAVPVVVYQNNEEEMGDSEPVISLIDAYDKMESDSLDDFDYFVDAYLVLSGLVADSDDVAEMKKNRVILLDENSEAKWLTKSGDSQSTESVKTRLASDIHKFAQVPDMTDEAFAGNASGVAIKYKTMPMENLVAVKERKFKKGLQKRIELIFTILNLKGGDNFDWRCIDIVFTRNLPANDTEVANMVSTLEGIVSDETLLAQLSFVENPLDELERIKQEKEENVAAFYSNVQNPFEAEEEDVEDGKQE